MDVYKVYDHTKHADDRSRSVKDEEENDLLHVQGEADNDTVGRIFGLGTITCYTGDVTNAELKLIHIRESQRKSKIIFLKASEVARMKRRTLNTLDIGAQDLSDALDS